MSHPNVQLVYAEILERDETKRPYIFRIKNKKTEKFLEFISESMTNAFEFQNIFYQKVIDDSNFRTKVDKYKNTNMNDKSKAEKAEFFLRKQFLSLMKNNTCIQKEKERQKFI